MIRAARVAAGIIVEACWLCCCSVLLVLFVVIAVLDSLGGRNDSSA